MYTWHMWFGITTQDDVRRHEARAKMMRIDVIEVGMCSGSGARCIMQDWTEIIVQSLPLLYVRGTGMATNGGCTAWHGCECRVAIHSAYSVAFGMVAERKTKRTCSTGLRHTSTFS